MKLNDIMFFIMANRRGKAFQNWSYTEILTHIVSCWHANLMYLAVNNKEEIIGIVTAQRFPDNTIHVSNILTTQPGVIRQFVRRADEMFPGWKLEGQRHGKIKEFNREKLRNKINLI